MLTKHLESIDSCAIPEAPASDPPVRTCPPRPAQRTRETSERGIPARAQVRARPVGAPPPDVLLAPAPLPEADSTCRSWGGFAPPSQRTPWLVRIVPHKSLQFPVPHELHAPGDRTDFVEARGWRKRLPCRNSPRTSGPGPPNRAQSRKKEIKTSARSMAFNAASWSRLRRLMTKPAIASAAASSVVLPITQCASFRPRNLSTSSRPLRAKHISWHQAISA